MQQYFEIPGLDVTIRKAIIDGVVYRLMRESGVSESDVYFNDTFNNMRQPGSTEGDIIPVEYAAQNRILIDVNEERDEMARINRGVGLDMEIPFFNDVENEVKAWAVRTNYNVEIVFTRRSKSQDELLRWTNRLNSLLDMGRYSMMTESEAYFQLPPNFLKLLNACYVAAETRVKKNESFAAYLHSNFGEGISTISNDAGNQKSLVVRYAPTRLEVVYDVAPPAHDKDEDQWTATFSAKFEYQRPEEIGCVYPYIINQTPVADEYMPQIDPPWLTNEEDVDRSPIQTSFDGTWWQNVPRELIRLPYLLAPTEQFQRIHSPLKSKLLHIFGTDIAFGEENMSNPYVLSTDDLPYEWNPELLPYINHCRVIDPTGMTGVFRTEIFEHGLIIEPRLYKWEGNELYLNREMDVRKSYFITESVMSDWRGMDLWPLQKYPRAAGILINWLFPTLSFPDWWWELPTLPPSIWEEIIDGVNGPNVRNHVMLTVLNTTVMAIKRSSDDVER
ncbi:MAG: hypothetical protein ACRDBQ_18670 [Shewanella sp.]